MCLHRGSPREADGWPFDDISVWAGWQSQGCKSAHASCSTPIHFQKHFLEMSTLLAIVVAFSLYTLCACLMRPGLIWILLMQLTPAPDGPESSLALLEVRTHFAVDVQVIDTSF
jgi:hypothetical protein